jgi:hypothetical protein
MAQDIDMDDAFAQQLLARTAELQRHAYPCAFYNVEGDCIEILLSDESYHAQRQDHLLTWLVSRSDGRIVGLVMKRVKAFIDEVLRKLPGFAIEIREGRIRLVYLVTAALWKSAGGEDSVKLEIIRSFREELDEANLDLELCA